MKKILLTVYEIAKMQCKLDQSGKPKLARDHLVITKLRLRNHYGLTVDSDEYLHAYEKALQEIQGIKKLSRRSFATVKFAHYQGCTN